MAESGRWRGFAEGFGLAWTLALGLADGWESGRYLVSLSWLIARRQSAGTHLSAITQNSLQGGWPV